MHEAFALQRHPGSMRSANSKHGIGKGADQSVDDAIAKFTRSCNRPATGERDTRLLQMIQHHICYISM